MEGIEDKIWEINPTNGIGYGFAVLVIATVSYVFYKKWQEERNYNKEIDEKVQEFMTNVIELLIKVEQRLNDQKDYKELLQKIEHEIQRIKKNT
jgi:CHASE3 domain sensor protein